MRKILLIIIFIILFTPIRAYSQVEHVSMEEAVSLALEKNLDIKSKRKKAEELTQEIKIANALKNPQFQSNFLMGKVTRGNSSQFGLAVPIEICKRGIRKNIAQINLKIAENEIRAAEHDLKIRVMSAYFNILYMKSVVQILQEREKMFRSIKSVADNHEQYELHTGIDIVQNDIKYKKQLILLNKAKANLLGAQFALNDVMNIENSKVMYDTVETSLFADDLEILHINLPEYQVIEDAAMKYSYSLSIAEQNIERKSVEVTQAKRKRIPDVTVAGGYAYQTAHQTKDIALPGAFVGAGFDVPIFYSFAPDVRKAKITLSRAEIDKASFENHLKFALKEDYNEFKYAKENIEHYQVILNGSKSVLENYKKRYVNGQVMLLNLLQVETAHQENVREYINAVQVYYDSYLSLMQNVGHDILLKDGI